jgi:GntR family transcriptional regulator / MocR family aminotransferase
MLSELVAAALDRGAPKSLTHQIYDAIRRLILAGTLKAGSRLPASRELAGDLAVARNTVIDAYAQLIAEGYLESRVGSGSYVSSTLPDDRPERSRAGAVQKVSAPVARGRSGGKRALSARAEGVLSEPSLMEGGAFAPCVPDLTFFPFTLWQRMLSKQWRHVQMRDTQYAQPGGHPELRAAVAEYLQLLRQVNCSPEQVIIVNGAQHGLDLCARLLADAGDRVWVEDPGYPGARRIFRAANLEMVPIPIDEEGLAPTAKHWSAPPRLTYITPSHQFPLGMVMSLKRRRDLLQRASRHKSWIIEDDYDGEFRFSGKPIASLQGIDDADRVIYLGTFSKALFPGLRLGYMVVPASICERFALASARLNLEGRWVEQGTLAAFIREGHFGSHIRRMRMVYAERHGALADVWRRELGDAAPLYGADTGMHVVAELPRGKDKRMSDEAGKIGVVAQSLNSLFLGTPSRSGLVLGYGAVHEKAIKQHGATLARLIAGTLRK